MALDAAEPLAGLGHPGGAPAQRDLAVLPCFTLRQWVRAMEIIDSVLLVLRRSGILTGSPPKPRIEASCTNCPTPRIACGHELET
jgi:hypothetical protein